MLNVKPVISIKHITKDDLLLISSPTKGYFPARVDCIDGADLYLVGAHDNLHFKGNNGKHHKTTMSELTRYAQVFKVYDEKHS